MNEMFGYRLSKNSGLNLYLVNFTLEPRKAPKSVHIYGCKTVLFD